MKRSLHLPTAMPILLAAFLLLTPSACTAPQPVHPDTPPAAESPSLYQRLGGQDAIAKIADQWVARAVADPRINARFAATDAPRLKQHLASQLGELTGGPEVYTGKDMKTAHKGLNISPAEWNAFLEDLNLTLDELKVAPLDHAQLLVHLEPMKSDIVGQ